MAGILPWASRFASILSTPAFPSMDSHYRHGGGYHQIYPEESSVHGCTSSRSGDRSWLDAEICRPSSGRYAGSGRSSSSGGRENRGSFRRSPYLDSVGDCARQNPFPPVTAQRSVALPIAQIQSSSSSLLPLKDHDKSSGGVIDGSGTGQRCDRDLSLGSISWKHRNWSRQSSLPSSKTFRSSSDDACHEASVAQGKDSPLRSPGTSPLPSDDGAPRKKPRLGWGQGLAKYEKQKVEGSVDCNGQNGLMFKDTIGGSSPKVMVFVGSMSPATPTSVTCSSSPGTEEKLSMKTLNLDADRAKDSSRLGLNGSPGNVSIKVGEIDADSVCTLASALNDLMQYEDACSGDSSFARFSTINKLLLLKNEISKELEKTEYEIDLFENELMSLASVEQRNYREHPLKSKSNVGGSSAESFDEPKTSLELPSNNSVLASSVFLEEEKAVQRAVSGECDAEVKVVNHDLTEAFSSGVAQFCLDRQNDNRNVLFDLCSEVNGKSIVPHFIDAEPLTPFTTVTPAVHLSCGLVGNSAAEKKSNSLLASVMNSSSDATKRVSEEFERAMCSMSSQVDIWESDKLLQCRKNYMLIKDKLAVEKRLLKFKERVLAHKFRVLHHLWREDLRLLAVLKHRPKSSKRLEVNIRSSQTALQRHRSSTRSRFLLPAGNLSLVPTTEILNFTSKILSCSQIRHYRNYLKMPAQIIDEKDKTRLRFNTKNGLIEDACSIEKERVAINPWTPEEKELFGNKSLDTRRKGALRQYACNIWQRFQKDFFFYQPQNNRRLHRVLLQEPQGGELQRSYETTEA
ncbi:hypothetical protein HPP92_006757 [Vanilla planifolia]|uniref:Uncharacterized protein n=1 Tax=Vanilla planifolia TaxID=51239 RepID=A0A835V9E9_VANPL|nr:hypothetical protein HPP92_006757 [Vanilla planifolia]